MKSFKEKLEEKHLQLGKKYNYRWKISFQSINLFQCGWNQTQVNTANYAFLLK